MHFISDSLFNRLCSIAIYVSVTEGQRKEKTYAKKIIVRLFKGGIYKVIKVKRKNLTYSAHPDPIAAIGVIFGQFQKLQEKNYHLTSQYCHRDRA